MEDNELKILEEN